MAHDVSPGHVEWHLHHLLEVASPRLRAGLDSISREPGREVLEERQQIHSNPRVIGFRELLHSFLDVIDEVVLAILDVVSVGQLEDDTACCPTTRSA